MNNKMSVGAELDTLGDFSLHHKSSQSKPNQIHSIPTRLNRKSSNLQH